MTISLRIDKETEKQIKKLQEWTDRNMPFKGKSTKTDIIITAIDIMYNNIMKKT